MDREKKLRIGKFFWDAGIAVLADVPVTSGAGPPAHFFSGAR
jgi:hypothetical protein